MKSNANMDKYCFYWPAVFVAAVIGVGLHFLVSLLSLAFNFASFAEVGRSVSVNVGGFLGLVILGTVATFFMGWIAGYLGRPFCIRKYYGELYGLTAWALSLILIILLASSASTLVGNTSYAVNKKITPVVLKALNPESEAKLGADPDTLAKTTFVVFFLFFVGAVSSSFGGRVAQYRLRLFD